MTKTKLTAEVLVDGTLRIQCVDDRGCKGVDMPAPVDVETVEIAAQHLVESLAGVSQSEIVLAGLKALTPELAA